MEHMDISKLNALYEIKQRIGKELISNNGKTKINDDVKMDRNANKDVKINNDLEIISNVNCKKESRYELNKLVST